MNAQGIDKLRQQLSNHKIDAFLITKPVNVNYLSGFNGEGQLIVAAQKKIVLVDFRFKEETRQAAKDWQIYERKSFSPWEENILRLVRQLKLGRLGFEALSLSYRAYHKLKRIIKPVKLVATCEVVERLRAIKSASEIHLLKKAALMAAKTLAFAKTIIRPGKREEELARELQYFMRRLGASDWAFEMIVASGKRSSLPHALPSSKVIRNNEAVLVDLGCRLDGYNSDLTRMFFLGKIKTKLQQIYTVVRQAQQLAINAVRAGVSIAQIDQIARRKIAQAGFSAFFGHSLGHGIGREVHEYPTLSPQSQDFLQEGMVFTVEPGIYIPGWGGVRVEDMVLVTKTGHEILSKI